MLLGRNSFERKEPAMPPFYCIKFGLLLAALILVAIVAPFFLVTALMSFDAETPQDKPAHLKV
jgi:hypothetical protein